MANPASQLLQCNSGRLSRAVLPRDAIQLLFKEEVISKETADEVESCGGVLVGDSLRAIYATVAEDHNKLKILASVLLKCVDTESLANELLQEYGMQ